MGPLLSTVHTYSYLNDTDCQADRLTAWGLPSRRTDCRSGSWIVWKTDGLPDRQTDCLTGRRPPASRPLEDKASRWTSHGKLQWHAGEQISRQMDRLYSGQLGGYIDLLVDNGQRGRQLDRHARKINRVDNYAGRWATKIFIMSVCWLKIHFSPCVDQIFLCLFFCLWIFSYSSYWIICPHWTLMTFNRAIFLSGFLPYVQYNI